MRGNKNFARPLTVALCSRPSRPTVSLANRHPSLVIPFFIYIFYKTQSSVQMPPSKRKPKVRVHFLGFPGIGGIGAKSALVSAGKVTEYVRDGAAQLVFPRNLPPASGTHGKGEGGSGMGQYGAADAGAAGGNSDDADSDYEVDGEPELIISRRTRLSVNQRTRQAENWQSTEAILTDMMLKDRLPDPCSCTRDDIVTVRMIDLNSYTHNEFQYCNCPRSSSCLLKAGYFPCAPKKPKIAFSIWLLQLLHKQSVLGYVLRSAWSGGLRALFEHEKKAVLPAFDREVSTPLDSLAPLNTEKCSCVMPTTTGSQ